MKSPKLIVALDTPELSSLESLITTLAPLPVLFKTHWISFPTLGFTGLKKIVERTGDRLMLDFKLHDIPNTVKHSVRSLLHRVPARLLTVHAQGGPAMLQAVRKELDVYAQATDGSELSSAPKLLAITLLTSLSDADLQAIGYGWNSREEGVLQLARMAHANGADGVVCTFKEARILRQEFGDDLLLVCPGLRLDDSNAEDHAHTATPGEARELGVDFVVVGRPIYRAENPRAVAESIINALSGQTVAS